MQNHNKVVSITMHRVDDSRVWVGVSFALRHEKYVPGECYINYSEDFRCNITPLNDEAAKVFEEDDAELAARATEEGEEYASGWGGWAGWAMDGAHKGFMLQEAPDRGVILYKLEGCLGADGDVEGIIWAATLGVMLLLGGDASQVETAGWKTTECCID